MRKKNPKTNKIFKIIKGKSANCGRNKSQILLSKGVEQKSLKKVLNASAVINQRCQIQHGVIRM